MDQSETKSALSDFWEWFYRLGFFWGRVVAAGMLVAIIVTYEFWKFMIPFWSFCALVVVYLRFTRREDSL